MEIIYSDIDSQSVRVLLFLQTVLSCLHNMYKVMNFVLEFLVLCLIISLSESLLLVSSGVERVL